MRLLQKPGFWRYSSESTQNLVETRFLGPQKPAELRNRVSCYISRDSAENLVETRFLGPHAKARAVSSETGFLAIFLVTLQKIS